MVNAKHYCGPNCKELVDKGKGKCPLHKRQADQGTRGTANQRHYTYGWSVYAKRFRALHPFCGERADGTRDAVNSLCVQRGIDTPASCVDHTVPLSAGGSMWDESNHMSCCHPCNAWKMNTIDKRTSLHG